MEVFVNIFRKLFSRPAAPVVSGDETDAAIFIYSQCSKCGEKFRSRIVKEHELVQNFEGNGPAFTARKELVGGRCRTVVAISLDFDARRRFTDGSIENGSFITKEEYERALP
jgi:hypothetical protein